MAVLTLEAIAGRIGGTVHGDPGIEIRGCGQLDTAGPGEITFLANPKYRAALGTTRASAVIIDGTAGLTPDIPHIVAPNAYFGFLQTFLLFHPPAELVEPGIHPSAVIDASASVADSASIGANVVIGPDVVVGEGTRIMANCVILNGVRIGRDCRFYPLVSVREGCEIGDRVILHNGAVIGSDGFGFAPHEGVYHKIPQVGTVVIEDDVEIGANTTIDRATMGETRICRGTKLDNLIHIAHNVTVGEHTVMAAQAGISGSTRIGHHVMIGGQVGTVGHIRIGDGAQIGAKSGVSKSIPDGEVWFGALARPIMKAKRIEAVTGNLPDLLKRIQTLEKELAALRERDDD